MFVPNTVKDDLPVNSSMAPCHPQLEREVVVPPLTIRTLNLQPPHKNRQGASTQLVTLLEYHSWPDIGTPDHNTLLQLVCQVTSLREGVHNKLMLYSR